MIIVGTRGSRFRLQRCRCSGLFRWTVLVVVTAWMRAICWSGFTCGLACAPTSIEQTHVECSPPGTRPLYAGTATVGLSCSLRTAGPRSLICCFSLPCSLRLLTRSHSADSCSRDCRWRCSPGSAFAAVGALIVMFTASNYFNASLAILARVRISPTAWFSGGGTLVLRSRGQCPACACCAPSSVLPRSGGAGPLSKDGTSSVHGERERPCQRSDRDVNEPGVATAIVIVPASMSRARATGRSSVSLPFWARLRQGSSFGLDRRGPGRRRAFLVGVVSRDVARATSICRGVSRRGAHRCRDERLIGSSTIRAGSRERVARARIRGGDIFTRIETRRARGGTSGRICCNGVGVLRPPVTRSIPSQRLEPRGGTTSSSACGTRLVSFWGSSAGTILVWNFSPVRLWRAAISAVGTEEQMLGDQPAASVVAFLVVAMSEPMLNKRYALATVALAMPLAVRRSARVPVLRPAGTGAHLGQADLAEAPVTKWFRADGRPRAVSSASKASPGLVRRHGLDTASRDAVARSRRIRRSPSSRALRASWRSSSVASWRRAFSAFRIEAISHSSSWSPSSLPRSGRLVSRSLSRTTSQATSALVGALGKGRSGSGGTNGRRVGGARGAPSHSLQKLQRRSANRCRDHARDVSRRSRTAIRIGGAPGAPSSSLVQRPAPGVSCALRGSGRVRVGEWAHRHHGCRRGVHGGDGPCRGYDRRICVARGPAPPSRRAHAGASAVTRPTRRVRLQGAPRIVLAARDLPPGSSDRRRVPRAGGTGLVRQRDGICQPPQIRGAKHRMVAYPEDRRRAGPQAGTGDPRSLHVAHRGRVRGGGSCADLACSLLLPFFFGQEFQSAVGIARVLLIGGLFMGMRRVLSDGARGIGRPGAGTMAEVVTWMVLLPALVFTLPLGILGVAWALTGSAARVSRRCSSCFAPRVWCADVAIGSGHARRRIRGRWRRIRSWRNQRFKADRLMSDGRVEIALQQVSIGDYRQAVLDVIYERCGSTVAIWCGPEYFEPTTRTAVTYLGPLTIVYNRFLWGRKLCMAARRHSPASRCGCPIVELNPRILSNWPILVGRRLRRRRTVLWGHAWSRAGPKSAQLDYAI